MLKLKFDTEAYKTRLFEGPFGNREEVENACVRMTMDQTNWSEYASWASAHGIDSDTGSIITTADNPFLLQARRDTLEQQLQGKVRCDSLGGPLHWAYIETHDQQNLRSIDAPEEELKVLSISSVRENVFFKANSLFPWLNTHLVCATTDGEHAAACNELVENIRPDLSTRLEFTPYWDNYDFDIVHINPALHYYDEEDLQTLLTKIIRIEPKYIALTDLLPNQNKEGKPEWFAQRSRGGIISLRIPAKGELQVIMQSAGYTFHPLSEDQVSFKVDPESSYKAQYPFTDNYYFTRDPV